MTALSQFAVTLQAFATPTIAATVAYIAYQQWKTNQRKEDRELKTAKLAVYRRVKALLGYIDNTREIRPDLYEQFCDVHAEADFLFPESIRNFLSEIEMHAAQWLAYKQDPDSTIEMDKEIDELQELHCKLLDTFSEHMK